MVFEVQIDRGEANGYAFLWILLMKPVIDIHHTILAEEKIQLKIIELDCSFLKRMTKYSITGRESHVQ